jgi:two-component system nitrogen regulation sensor histidine kinase GlnL
VQTRPKAKAPAPASAAGRPPAWTDVLASIDVGVIVLDASGRVTDVNPAGEHLLGISDPQARGIAAGRLLGRRAANHWLAALVDATLVSSTAHSRSEGQLAGRWGEVPVSAACTPLHGGDGAPAGAVLVLHDLTLQRTLDAATQRADRLAALGPVAQGLAHEIRNPLGGIRGAAQLLQRKLADPDLLRCAEIIVREVDRLDSLVEQLRELGAAPPLDISRLNIHEILDRVLELQRAAPGWGRIRLRTEFDPSLPEIRGDRGQLTQVFLNLVKNAVEALAGQGELVVSTRIETSFHVRRAESRGQLLSVVVEDSGPGIPSEQQALLFTPFFTTKPRGTGLGLALCNRIVTQHGGTIAHEPRGRREGARFRVSLPVGDRVDDAR